ncbi:sphingosine-1-phosphate lyase 1-like [Apostichopus japonicus]|uniref:sphingosine-1-phosphate lyase 1-like n=1 Tax=Stichopus japonicus TaxID=307972 RepID=UPI003AB62FD4
MDAAQAIAGDVLEATVIYLEKARVAVNGACRGFEGWQIILIAAGVTLLVTRLYNWLDHPRLTIRQRVVHNFWSFLKGLPIIRGKVKAELAKNVQKIGEEMYPTKEGDHFLNRLPADGISSDEIFKRLEQYKTATFADWKGGKVSGCVYGGTEELSTLCAKVYHDFAWTNPLHPDVFPEVRRMEAEVVSMSLKLFHGGPNSGGTMTSGGTESILLAMQTYRDIAWEKGIDRPEIIAAVSAHAAFNKASHYFGIRLILVPNDPKTHTLDVRAMKKKISKNTCCLVASAPSFPYGLLDDIEAVSKLGERYNVPVHVDACLGGFLIPFMEKAGFPLPPFDFRLPGVTSISADTHKYGYAPKGSSVILYKDKETRNFQFFVAGSWSGGIYATPTMAGSRPGALIAGCWATMMYFGERGYVSTTRRIIAETRYITQQLRKIKDIYVFGDPLISVVAVGSDKFDVFRAFAALGKKGWNLNSLQFPASFHLCVTQRQTRTVSDQFIKDVRDCVKEVMKDPGKKAEGAAALYGTAQAIPDRSIITEMARGYLAACYNTAMGESNGVSH